MRNLWWRLPPATRILLVLQGVWLLVCIVALVFLASGAIGFAHAATWILPLLLLVTVGPLLAGQVNRYLELERIARRTLKDDTPDEEQRRA